MEVWDAYDRDRQMLANQTLERSKFPYDEEMYHLAVNVWVQHEDGDWLFMKRSSLKEHYPDVYEVGAGGSVIQGETSLEAAKRELIEETGMSADQLDFLFSFTEMEHKTHFDTYLARVSCDKDAVSYQKEETDGHCWVASKVVPEFLSTYPVFENQSQQLLEHLKK